VGLGTRLFDRSGKPLTAVGVVSDPSYPEAKQRLPSRGFPNDVHPVVEVEFPGKGGGDPPIKRTYAFDRRC
jgi:hypothetical protein